MFLPGDVCLCLLSFLGAAGKHALRATCRRLYGLPADGTLVVAADGVWAKAACCRRVAWATEDPRGALLPFWGAKVSRVVLELDDGRLTAEFCLLLAGIVNEPGTVEVRVLEPRVGYTHSSWVLGVLNWLAGPLSPWQKAWLELRCFPTGTLAGLNLDDLCPGLCQRLRWCDAPLYLGNTKTMPHLRNAVSCLGTVTAGCIPALECFRVHPSTCDPRYVVRALASFTGQLKTLELTTYNDAPPNAEADILRVADCTEVVCHSELGRPLCVVGGFTRKACIVKSSQLDSWNLGAVNIRFLIGPSLCPVLAATDGPLALENCRVLQIDRIGGWDTVFSACVVRILRSCRSLRRLVLYVGNSSNGVVDALPPTLVSLRLVGRVELGGEDLARLTRRLPLLRTLELEADHTANGLDITCGLAQPQAGLPWPTVYIDSSAPWVLSGPYDPGPSTRSFAPRGVSVRPFMYEASMGCSEAVLGWRASVECIRLRPPLGRAFWDTAEVLAQRFPLVDTVIVEGRAPLSAMDAIALRHLCVGLGAGLRSLCYRSVPDRVERLLFGSPRFQACPWAIRYGFTA